jgi:hypothetical protein
MSLYKRKTSPNWQYKLSPLAADRQYREALAPATRTTPKSSTTG